MAKKQIAFYFDQNRCMGCDACVVACKDWNNVNPGPAEWRRKYVEEDGSFPNLAIFNLVMSCNHCTNPACLKACPVGAIYKREEDGIVLVDRSLCINILACKAACPFSAPQFADDKSEPTKDTTWQVPHPMQKCTFCWDRLEDGLPPACVASCPQRALDYGTVEEIFERYPNAQRTVVGFPDSTVGLYGSPLDEDTLPNIYFNPKIKPKIY
ncbi:MAG: 4Fe-4S dicluster domain-containing protein [Deferribacterota bacterium]|nr:4Fe-4S dicluster domain-containing protein [Deferribacterota bacterium]